MIVNPGIRRFLGSAIQRLFNSASFYAPLTHTAVPQRAATGTTATFTRATTKTVENNDGYLVTLLAGEIGFPGARRVRNLQATSSEPTSGWTAAGATPPTVTYTTLDGSGAVSMAFPVVAAGYANSRCSGPVNSVSWVQNSTKIATQMVVSLSRALTGSEALTLYLAGTSALDDVIVFNASNSPTSAVLQSVVDTFVNPTFSGTMGIMVYVSGAIVGSPVTLSLTRIQFEDVTAQTTQTEGEYVSVGALDYRSDKDPLYLSLPGTTGHYASTSDSVLGSNSPDKIEAKIALVDWSPAVGNIIAGKRSGAGQITAVFYVAAGGALSLFASLDGTASSINANSTANVSFPDLQDGYVKYERNESTGVIKFFTSSDGSAWTQLGADVAAAAGALYDSTSPWEIGSQLGGTSSNLNGKIYWVTGYSSSTPIFDFNPHRDATTPTGTITSSTTGEVWTINGASSVVRSAAYHGSMVDGVKCFPTDLSGNPIPSTTLLGYSAEGARTNLCLQSNAFTTSWLNIGTPSATQNVVGPDDATSAWTLTDNDAGAAEAIEQEVALTAAAYTLSVFVGKTSGAQSSYPCFAWYTALATDMQAATIDTTNGVITDWTGYTGFTMAAGRSVRISSYNEDFWRVELTKTGTTTGHKIDLFPAGTTNPTQSTGTLDATAQGSAVFYGAQVELGSFASSYTPTTTAAVTRAADVLTYSSAGNILGTVGSAYAELSTYWTTVQAGGSQALGMGAVSVGPFLNSATGLSTGVRIFDGTNVADDTSTLDMYRTPRKRAARWGSDIAVCADGGAVVTGTFDGSMGSVLYIGCAGDTTQQWQGTIKNVRIWQRALSSSELGAITA